MRYYNTTGTAEIRAYGKIIPAGGYADIPDAKVKANPRVLGALKAEGKLSSTPAPRNPQLFSNRGVSTPVEVPPVERPVAPVEEPEVEVAEPEVGIPAKEEEKEAAPVEAKPTKPTITTTPKKKGRGK